MSRLPVRRKERIKVTASVLTSGSKKVALQEIGWVFTDMYYAV